MRITVTIGCVDSSHLQIGAYDARAALDFLDKHDHEGADIHVQVQTDRNEEVYKLLGAIAEVEW